MAAPNSDILERLANDIMIAAKQMSDDLKSLSSSKAEPEIGQKALAGSLAIPPDAPAKIRTAKATLFEATTVLQQLISSPIDYQQSATMNNNFLACTRWLCTFDIHSHVPAPPASISYHELALKASVPESQLTRIARMAMCAGQFHEPIPNQIAHTPLSFALRSPSVALDTMLFLTEISAPSAQKMTEMTQAQSANSSADGPPNLAFNIALSTPQSFYAFLSSNPVHAKRLAASMKMVSGADESHVRHLISGFDWASLPSGSKVIDIGGSTGHVSFALANAFPELQYVVQDLKGVIEAQPPVAEELSEKVSFQSHDFFNPQPPSNHNASIFLIRQCLQNWPDDKAILILKQLLPSLENNPNAKIVIMNVILPSPQDETVGQRAKAVARFRDMLGMQALGAKERDLNEWKALVKEADERLEVGRVVTPKGSVLSVMEVGMR